MFSQDWEKAHLSRSSVDINKEVLVLEAAREFLTFGFFSPEMIDSIEARSALLPNEHLLEAEELIFNDLNFMSAFQRITSPQRIPLSHLSSFSSLFHDVFRHISSPLFALISKDSQTILVFLDNVSGGWVLFDPHSRQTDKSQGFFLFLDDEDLSTHLQFNVFASLDLDFESLGLSAEEQKQVKSFNCTTISFFTRPSRLFTSFFLFLCFHH